jgi:hypothetical protein
VHPLTFHAMIQAEQITEGVGEFSLSRSTLINLSQSAQVSHALRLFLSRRRADGAD